MKTNNNKQNQQNESDASLTALNTASVAQTSATTAIKRPHGEDTNLGSKIFHAEDPETSTMGTNEPTSNMINPQWQKIQSMEQLPQESTKSDTRKIRSKLSLNDDTMDMEKIKMAAENYRLKQEMTIIQKQFNAQMEQMNKTIQLLQQKVPMDKPFTIDSIETSNRYHVLELHDTNTNNDNTMEDDNNNNEGDPFITVKNNIRKKNKNLTTIKTTTKKQQQPQPTIKSKSINGQQTNNNNKQSTSTEAPAATSNNTKRNIRPPPIHIHQQQIGDTINLIKGIHIDKFNVKRVSKNKHTLQIENMDNYEAAKNVLKEVETKYFTYTPKIDKPKTVVLKGLHEKEDPNEIKQLLTEHNINVLKVTQLKTKHATRKNLDLPLYIVQCSPETNLGQVFNIKTLNYQRVSWEHLKKNNEITQCFKCQRFGHVAINCNLGYRCVKCEDEHEPGQCRIQADINKEEIYCTNCSTKGHPASYKGCPVYIATVTRLREKIQQKRTQTKQPAQIQITKQTYVNAENGTFAEMLAGGKKQQQQQTTNNMDSDKKIQQLTQKIDTMANTIAQQGAQIQQLLSIIKDVLNE